ncbi:GNAT family N-acetyltransferase [Kitasatospora sp. NPDC088346]|uniref:GNAT family N-acetyltransferase n=1 Tax=Kitasatospora sp. NPDC088346 TaxID=3364073 RepID=UPI00382B83CA
MRTGYRPVPARQAAPEDVDAMVDALTTAFFDDPLWGPAFPDAGRRAVQAAAMWRLYVTSALRYPWTLVTPAVESVAVLIPPGGTELAPEDEEALEPLLTEVAGPEVARAIGVVCEQLEAARPTGPHFYLTLLGTHRDHRGKGLGMGLLAEALTRVDALGAPCYLESSNPANDVRYGRHGFVPHGRVALASGHAVTTMWRPAR